MFQACHVFEAIFAFALSECADKYHLIEHNELVNSIDANGVCYACRFLVTNTDTNSEPQQSDTLFKSN